MTHRPATLSDASFLLHVRNDAHTRAMCFRDHEVGIEDILGRGETYIASLDGIDYGYFQIEDTVGQIEVSWYIAPEHRRKGYGHILMRGLLKQARSPFGPIVAAVKVQNIASLILAEQYMTRVLKHNGVVCFTA